MTMPRTMTCACGQRVSLIRCGVDEHLRNKLGTTNRYGYLECNGYVYTDDDGEAAGFAHERRGKEKSLNEPWTPTEVAALRRYAENRPKTFREFYADSIDPFRMLATIDAQATEIAALKGALESIEDAWAKLVEPGWQKHVASLKGADAPEASHAWVKHIFTFQLAGFRARVLAGKEAQG